MGADGWNPTDNLVPFDYLHIYDEECIPVPVVRADYAWRRSTLQAIWLPVFTPTRLPLLGQCWFPKLPSEATVPTGPPVPVAVRFRQGPRLLPARTFENSQWAIRWDQLVRGFECSVSYFDGFGFGTGRSFSRLPLCLGINITYVV
ncbi:MAG: hypothetical protein HY652_13225 [Acidobacteria bacterium]|nr:hypothetical protein [Acidobacteriota bacterium]